MTLVAAAERVHYFLPEALVRRSPVCEGTMEIEVVLRFPLHRLDLTGDDVGDRLILEMLVEDAAGQALRPG